MDTTNTLGFYGLPNFNWAGIAIAVIVFILIFLLVREVMLWYWKVDEVIDLLKKIEQNTKPNKPEVK